MTKEKLLISSCLAGQNVRYDASNNLISEFEFLKEKFDLQYICPEVQSGMPTPRTPCEIISLEPLKVQNKFKIDTTDYFIQAAKITLDLCKKLNIKYALLKSNSPSCGNDKIYNGSFNKTLINSMGITAKTLHDNNIKVFNETQIKDLYEFIK